MVQAAQDTPFVQDVHTLADTVGPLHESKAREWLDRYPMDTVFRELNGPHITPDLLAKARTALEKVFSTTYGSSMLPGLVPYAAAALQPSAAAPPLRQLAVQQLARLLCQLSAEAQQGPAAGEEGQVQQLLGLLLDALEDKDVGVAFEAERALAALAAPPAPLLPALLSRPPAAPRMSALAASADPVVAIRALTLALRIAAASPEAGATVRAAGLLQPLLSQLADPSDVLAAAAALQLVQEAAEGCDPGMAGQLQEAVGPALAALAGAQADVVLRCAALQASAALLSTSLESGVAPMAVDAPGPAAAAATAPPHAVLASLKAVLDVSSAEEFPQELEEAALDAVGSIGLKPAGAAAILEDPSRLIYDVAYTALGRAPNPAIRIVALHALASVAGAERAAGAGRRAAAMLGQVAEDTLRSAVFEGALASSPTATPADVALDYLGQPFLELRVATYRALSALLARDWAAAVVCSHGELLAFLLDPQSEAGKQGCEWRYACVLSLASTIRAALGAGGSQYEATLAAAAQSVEKSAALGPYGAKREALEQFQVATLGGS